MANKSHVQQKQRALQYLTIARQRWESLGTKYPDYLSDRDAFYKCVRQEVLPDFVGRGGDEDTFLEAMREYARDDWVKSGFSEKEFDQKFNTAKRRTYFNLLLGIIGSVFILLIEKLLETFFEISVAKFIGQEDARGYVVLFILSLIVIITVITAVKWVQNRQQNCDNDEISPLKLDL